MGSCSRAVESGTRSDRAALKATLWDVGSCFLVTTASMVAVNIVFSNCRMHCASLCTSSNSKSFLSDDVDDWDLEVLPKPSEVQNDLYASNEDEEDEGEDMEGTKVTVSCCVKSKNGNSSTFSANLHLISLLSSRCSSPEMER